MLIRRDEGLLLRPMASPPDAPKLYFNAVRPDGAVRAAIGLVHGFAEYGARYAHVMDAWAEKGIATVSVDLRGHGRAEGTRGFCRRFAEYLDDAAELVPLLRDRAPEAPAFLFGHSLGGLVASSLAIAKPSPWRGLVLSGPFFAVAEDLPRLQLLAVRIASHLAPKLGQSSGLHGADLTHDAERARAYDDDPLVFKTVRARWFTETQEAQRRALVQAPSLTLPLYVVVGTADRVVNVDTARVFFDAAGSRDKTWDARDGLFHEVLNEPEWRGIADAIVGWVTSHT